jgi:DNA modification methylase
MAFLDSQLLTVEAILTQKGRELLAKNDGSFNIQYFALGDDEIDYSLWNPNHPKGSAFYGEAIENTPIMEANPNQNQVLISKLISLPKGTSKIPILTIGAGSIVLKQGASITITPQTLNYNGSNTTFETNGYVVMVNDIRLLSSFKGVGVTDVSTSSDTTVYGAKVTKSELGTSFTLTATSADTLFTSNLTELVSTITITGRDSGAFISIPLIIQKK